MINEESLDQVLNERFGQFERKFEQKLDKRFEEFERRIDAKIDHQFAVYFGKMDRYIDKKINVKLTPINTILEHTSKILDYLVKHAETVDQECTIMNSQLDRHEGWMKQLP